MMYLITKRASLISMLVVTTLYANGNHDGIKLSTGEVHKRPITDVVPDDRYELDGLQWGPVEKNVDGSLLKLPQGEAEAHCKGVGKRLPTKEQFMYLRGHLGYPDDYNPRKIQGLARGMFWCAAADTSGNGDVDYFIGRIGGFSQNKPSTRRSVLCVADVPPKIYKANGLLWGPAVRNSDYSFKNTTWEAAKAECKEPQRLPTPEEYEALARHLGFPNDYKPGKVFDLAGNRFWTSSPGLYNKGKYFSGDDGRTYSMDLGARRKGVRCVSDDTAKGK